MSLLNELKRRNVIRVAIAYAVVSWVLIQIGNILFSTLELGPEPAKILLAILLLGFIPAVIFAWAFEITPEGIKKEKDVTHDESITNLTAKKLDMVTIGLLVVAIGLFALDRFSPREIQSADTDSSNTVFPADDYKDVGGRVTQGAKTEAGIQSQDTVNEISNKSIAVLPFANMANNAENEPFTVGLHDDLLTHLSRISALKVISRTSVMEYKDTTKKIKDIANELGVANILEGGVQRSGNQIRLNVQLIDAATDEHLWAEIYDEELTTANIFNIQTKISKKIAAALKAQLTDQESESISKAPTDNLEAYDAYLAGRQLIENRESVSLKRALVLFQKATELDPNYALAYVGQATALVLLNEYSDLPKADMFAQGEPLITKALTLDPLLAEAHAIKGNYLMEQSKFAEAEASFKLSLSLNPNYPTTYHWYGVMLRNELNRNDEALVVLRKGAELDPLSSIILINVGWSLQRSGKIQEAQEQFQSVHEMNPDFTGALHGLRGVDNLLGNYAQAMINHEKATTLDPGNIASRSWFTYLYLNMGDLSAAQLELENSKKISSQHDVYVYQEWLLDVFTGNYEGALQSLVVASEKYPEDIRLKDDLAFSYLLIGDCDSALSQWQAADPEIFTSDYSLNGRTPTSENTIAWCLKQTGQEQAAELLLEKVRLFLSSNSNINIWDQIIKIEFLAVQGKPKEAANVYAELIASKMTSSWFWFDHLPFFADMRKEPVFIKAREQLMKDLKVQRELLVELRKNTK